MNDRPMPAQLLTNAFTHSTAAARYARGRPYYHPVVVDRIGRTLGLSAAVPQALDVGCGTGQSSRALLALAESVVGVDPSPAMLAHGSHDPGLTFVVAPAEKLPFPRQAFDLLTVAAAFHWFDRAPFLTEAVRVLRPAAWLVLYDNAFLGTMDENVDFATWTREVYSLRYPAPPRDRRPLTAKEAHEYGLELWGTERYTNTVVFTPQDLVDYLLTQSNVIAAIEGGREPEEAVRAWLLSAVEPRFPGPRGTFHFGGSITYLQTLKRLGSA